MKSSDAPKEIKPFRNLLDVQNRVTFPYFSIDNKNVSETFLADKKAEIEQFLNSIDEEKDSQAFDKALNYYKIGTELLIEADRLSSGKSPAERPVFELCQTFGELMREKSGKKLEAIIYAQSLPQPGTKMTIVDRKNNAKSVKITAVMDEVNSLERKVTSLKSRVTSAQPTPRVDTLREIINRTTHYDQLIPKEGIEVLKRVTQEKRKPTQKEAMKLIELQKSFSSIPKYNELTGKYKEYSEKLDKMDLPTASLVPNNIDAAKARAKEMLNITGGDKLSPELQKEVDKIATLLTGERTGKLGGVKTFFKRLGRSKQAIQRDQDKLVDKAIAKSTKHRLPSQVKGGADVTPGSLPSSPGSTPISRGSNSTGMSTPTGR